MFKKFFIIVIAFTAILTTGLISQDLPAINFKSLDDKMPLAPEVLTGKLDNGITYFIRENRKPENRADLQMVIRAGSLQEDDDQAGLAHFIEHMCFNGTKNFPKNDLIKFLESLGMKFGGDLNANTGFERTYYMLTIPMDRAGVLDTGFQVLEDWLHNVTFDPEELEKERGVIMEEWRLRLGAQERVFRKHFPYIYYDSKYPSRLPIGDTIVIRKAPRQRFVDFYNDWYRTDITAIIAVGDFDKNVILKKIKDRFSKIPMTKNPRERKDYDIGTHKEPFVTIAKDKEQPYSLVQFYFKHPGRQVETYRNYRNNLVGQIMSTIIGQRLDELMHKTDPPFLFARAQETHFVSNMRAFFLLSALKETGLNDGLTALLTEAFRAVQHGFTQTELDRVKNEMLTYIEKAYKEKDKTESGAYASELARNFDEAESAPGIAYEFALYKKWMPEITLDDINSMIKDVITKDNLTIALSLPDKEGAVIPTEKDILALYNNLSNQKFEAYVDKVSSSPLFGKTLGNGRIINQEEIKELQITKFTMSNGVKVVLKPTDFKNDEILLQAYSPGGNSQIDDAGYLSASLADGLIDDAGISQFDAVALQKLLSGKVVSLSPTIGRMTEGFRGSSSPNDLETMMQLINLYFTEPRKDEENFKSYMTKLKESIKNAKLDPRSEFYDTVNYCMSSYHPRTKPLTETLLDQIDYEKAFAFYQDRYADASDFTFVLVGSFKIDEIKPLLQKYLGTLPSLKRSENGKDVGERFPKGVITKEMYKGEAKQSTVRMAFTGDFEWNDQNKYDIGAMIQVLNIKLREAIREDKGGTYGIGARALPSKFPVSTYRIDIYFGCDPDRTDDLVKSVIEVIKGMQNTKVELTDIEKVKEIQKRSYETDSKENRFWLRMISDDLYNNDDTKTILTYNDRINKLDAETVMKTAKKYFNFDNFATFKLFPEKK